MYKPKHFEPYELVDRETYLKFGDGVHRLFDNRLLKLLDYLRDNLGPVVINDWKWSKHSYDDSRVFKWSGLRTPESPYYRTYSMHSHGKAFDLKFNNHDAEYVRLWIASHWEDIKKVTGLPSLTLEKDVSWVHVQVDNKEGLHYFKP